MMEYESQTTVPRAAEKDHMKKLDYAIVFVSDMKRSIAFYRDILVLPLKFESPEWSEFANEGSTIALHLADSVNPPRAGEGITPAGSCHLGFQVEDLNAFHRDMQAKRVRCINPPKRQDVGIYLALYADPDGLPISVAEAPKK
jgi:lactoylglutathione lyase